MSDTPTDVDLHALQATVNELQQNLATVSTLFVEFFEMPFFERLLWVVGVTSLYNRVARWKGIQ